MRLSCFNVYVPNHPEPGTTLVHNTLAGSFVELADDVLAALRKADAGEALTESERALVDDPDLRDPDVAVVVASREAEEAEFHAWFERRRYRGAVDALVSVNLACNFDCPYCTQAKILDGTVMTESVADATADWLAERALGVGAERVDVVFCGGEPLLHPARIERIATRMRARLAPRGLGFEFRLITNGYYLTEAMLDRLVPLGLTGAQVTIDGDETTHALTRVHKKGEDTFQRLFDNVVAASRRIRIAINGNYQDDTIHGFAPLIAKLAEAGLDRSSRVSFSPALETLSSEEGVGSGACNWAGSNTDLHVAFKDEIRRHGFDVGAPPNVVGPCELHDTQHFSIDPDGTIYKCPGFMGHSEWGIGHVERGLTGDLYDRIVAAAPNESTCSGCTHRPNCGGGCLAATWLERGGIDGVNCEHDFFERVSGEAVVREYLLAASDSLDEALAAFPAPTVALPKHVPASRTPSRGRRSEALRVVAA